MMTARSLEEMIRCVRSNRREAMPDIAVSKSDIADTIPYP
jgi:hypothetical protein